MAITFSKAISTSKLLNAYNNNVVEFTSDAIPAGESIKKASILINGSTFEITPDNNNVLRFNFKEVVKVAINNNFKDTITPTTDLHIDNTLKGSYTVTYTITFTDSSTETINKTYVFVKSVEQIANVSNRLLTEQQILGRKTLTAFNGYPFDITRYSDGDVTITNTATAVAATLTSTATNTERIYFDLGNSKLSKPDEKTVFMASVLADGGTWIGESCYVYVVGGDILKTGLNTITVVGTITETLTIDLKDISCGGTYLKWFNQFGGWTYWLFQPIHKEKITTKTIDTFNNDFDSIDNTYTTELITGKTATYTRALKAEALTSNEMLQLRDIITSPRIEMYNGSYGDAVTSSSWQTVSIKSASQIVNNTKHNLIDFKVTIKINQYTQV